MSARPEVLGPSQQRECYIAVYVLTEGGGAGSSGGQPVTAGGAGGEGAAGGGVAGADGAAVAEAGVAAGDAASAAGAQRKAARRGGNGKFVVSDSMAAALATAGVDIPERCALCIRRKKVGPGRYCSPRHRHAFEPSLLEFTGFL